MNLCPHRTPPYLLTTSYLCLSSMHCAGVVEINPDLSILLFAQKISPETKTRWQPPIDDREHDFRNDDVVEDEHTEPNVSTRRKRHRVDQEDLGEGGCLGAHPDTQPSPTQDERQGSGYGNDVVLPTLPASGVDFSTWLVKNLRGFLQVCLRKRSDVSAIG